MFEAFYSIDMISMMAAMIFIFIVIVTINQLLTAKEKKWNYQIWIAYICLGLGLTSSLVWIINLFFMWWFLSWNFVEDRILLFMPLTLILLMITFLQPFRLLNNLRKKGNEQVEITIWKLVKIENLLPVYGLLITITFSFISYWFQRYYLVSINTIMVWWVLQTAAICLIGFLLRYKQGNLNKRSLKKLPFIRRILPTTVVTMVLFLSFFTWLLVGMQQSKIEGVVNHHSNIDLGGGDSINTGNHEEHHAHGEKNLKPSANKLEEIDTISVQNLVDGSFKQEANQQFTLEARKEPVMLASGKKVEAWTYNGELAPEIRVQEGDIIEVILKNKDIEAGVTIHWHGYDVPNAMDGVPGMTQDAVMPGESFTYKFYANETGTHWFHSHQHSSEQVKNGLFGSFIVESKEEVVPVDKDITALMHTWTTIDGEEVLSFSDNDQVSHFYASPGEVVRLRISNTDNIKARYTIHGVPFRVTAIDGEELEEPHLIEEEQLEVSGAGRIDVVFTMPDEPIEVLVNGRQDIGLVISSDDDDIRSISGNHGNDWPVFDPGSYSPIENQELSLNTVFDRDFEIIMDNEFGFYDGTPNFVWKMNGEVFPNTPTFMVKEGEKVKMSFVNRTFAPHPMHLHGHHILVLSRNGEELETPWLADTLNVDPGEQYEVAFVADNPGMWMNHCHNLNHAEIGMTLHLSYEGIETPYTVGDESINDPH